MKIKVNILAVHAAFDFVRVRLREKVGHTFVHIDVQHIAHIGKRHAEIVTNRLTCVIVGNDAAATSVIVNES